MAQNVNHIGKRPWARHRRGRDDESETGSLIDTHKKAPQERAVIAWGAALVVLHIFVLPLVDWAC